MNWPIEIPGIDYYYVDDWTAIVHGDCLSILKSLPANCFDLCLTDPPYGTQMGNNGRRGGKLTGKAFCKSIQYTASFNDENPIDAARLEQCQRVAKDAIIWGGNHFELAPQRGWIVWDKETGGNRYGDAELAWSTLDMPIKMIRHQWKGMFKKLPEKRTHPTQKPLSVMRQCAELCAAKTMIDPFMGSGTTLEAAKQLNRHCLGIELEEKFCAAAVDRLRQEVFSF